MANIWFLERALRRERVFRDRSNPLEIYSDPELIERFRFPQETILLLAGKLEDRITPGTARNHSVPTVLQVCVALRFYATGSFLNSVGDAVGLHKSTVSRIVYRVSSEISKMLPEFPTNPNALNKLKVEFHAIAGFPNVVGAIDGTHVRLQAPSSDEHLYVNRKGYHSINVQAICDANLKITNCVARWAGSTHDSRILLQSHIGQAFEQGLIDGILLGDSGYPLKPWLLTPYLNPRNRSEERYNHAHCKTRNTVERNFGVLKRRFHCLHGELRMSPARVCKIIGACVVLHNMARYLTSSQNHHVFGSCIIIEELLSVLSSDPVHNFQRSSPSGA